MDFLTYIKTKWSDTASTGSGMSANNMNNIEDGLYKVSGFANNLYTYIQPHVLYKRTLSQDTPPKAPETITLDCNVNSYQRLVIYGVTNEYKRCSVDLIKDSNSTPSFNAMYFTLACYNGSGENAYLKMTDYKIKIANNKTTLNPIAYNELAGEGTVFATHTAIGPTVFAVYGYAL